MNKPILYYVFSSPNHSKDIQFHGIFYGADSVRQFFYRLYFPKEIAVTEAMYEYGYASFVLDKLYNFPNDNGLPFPGKDNVTFWVHKDVPSYGRGFPMSLVMAKKEATASSSGFQLLYASNNKQKAEQLSKEYTDEGYNVGIYYTTLLQ